MSIIFTGDCHFKDHLISKIPEITGDSELALSEVVRICIEDYKKTKDTALILGGDIWDVRYPAPHLIGMVKDAVAELKKAGIPTYFIEGNHDKSTERSWGEVVGGISLHGKTYTICGRKVYGLNNMRRDDLLQALAAVPEDVEVLVCHQALKDALSFVSAVGDISWNMEKEDVPPNIRLVLLADIHVSESYLSETALFAYPGSLTIQNIKEAPDKFLITVNPENLEIDYLPVDSRPIINKVASSNDEMIALYNEVKAGLPPSMLIPLMILSYGYAEEFNNAPVYLEKMKEFKHVWVYPTLVYSGGEVDEDVSSPTSITGVSMAEHLHYFIDQNKDLEAYEFMSGLLSSTDRKGYLASVKKSLIESNK